MRRDIRALMSDIDDEQHESKRPRIGFKTPEHDTPESRRHARASRRQLVKS